MRRLQRYNSGFSLIEILVALVISAIILAGVVQIFAGSKEAERLNQGLARLQENGRFAIETLNYEFRLAGYQGCTDPNQIFIHAENIIAEDFALTSITDQVIGGTTVPAGGGAVTLYGGAITIDDAVGGTDIVAITYASPTYEELKSPATGTDDLLLEDNQAGFAQNDVLLLSNCIGENLIFRASSIGIAPAPITISHSLATNSTNALGDTGNTYHAGSRVQRIATNTYFIRENPRNIRSLYRKTINGNVEELIEGVENLQILYGYYENNGTFTTTDDEMSWVNAETINGSPNLSWRNISSFKAAVLLADDGELLATDGPASYEILDSVVAPQSIDKRLRRVFATSAKVRNRDAAKVGR